MFLPKSKKRLLEEGYTHHCKIWGIPCYIGDIDGEAPLIQTANFIPQWVLDLGDWICLPMLSYINRGDPYYRAGWSIFITRPL